MPPIRKGDGTPVAPKGISQVRTGDGRILFDDVAIPDSGLLQHYAADSGALNSSDEQAGDGEAVETWEDLSGNGRDLVASGAPTLNDNEVNSLPSIDLDGTDDRFTASHADIDMPFTYIFVTEYTSNEAGYLLDSLDDANRADTTVQLPSGSNGSRYRIRGGGTFTEETSAFDDGTYRVHACLFETGTDNAIIRVNGSVDVDDSFDSGSLEGGVSVGAAADDTTHSNVGLAEQALYDHTDFSTIEGAEEFLADKYGIALS